MVWVLSISRQISGRRRNN